MASTAEQAPQEARQGAAKQVHHGRTGAAWAGTSIAMIAVVLGGISVIIQNWPFFWVCVGLMVVALIVTVVLQRMGHGAH